MLEFVVHTEEGVVNGFFPYPLDAATGDIFIMLSAYPINIITHNIPLEHCPAVTAEHFLSQRIWDVALPAFPSHASGLLEFLYRIKNFS